MHKAHKTETYKTNTVGENTTPIFVIQKAFTPKNGVEFRQRSIGVIRCSLPTSYDNMRSRATSPKVFCHKQTDRQTKQRIVKDQIKKDNKIKNQAIKHREAKHRE